MGDRMEWDYKNLFYVTIKQLNNFTCAYVCETQHYLANILKSHNFLLQNNDVYLCYFSLHKQ